MREWKLYLKCLRHNDQASSMAAVCLLGLTGVVPAHLWGDLTVVGISVGLAILGFLGFVLSGAGADTFGQYLITRHTITSAEPRPTNIRISHRLERSEQIGAELACKQFSVSFR